MSPKTIGDVPEKFWEISGFRHFAVEIEGFGANSRHYGPFPNPGFERHPEVVGVLAALSSSFPYT